jgi:NADH-quinone oxidoreductase subunit N
MLLTSTQDLIAIYVALELTSISQYVLAAFLRNERATEAGLKYLLLGAISSAVLLYGMAFLFGLSGQTGLAGIFDAVAASGSATRPAFILAVVLLAAGFGFKLAIVPFQMWVPDVYEGAPTPVTMYLSVASKAAGFAVVLRVFIEALGHPNLLSDWTVIFAVLAAISMTVGNVIALLQSNIKRLFGYSSIAQAGYMLVGIAAASGLDGDPTPGASGVLFFIAGYAFTNLGAFVAIIAISNRIGTDRIADYAGMIRRSPFLAMALALCLVSLTGIPLTAGFWTKLYIFNAAVRADLVWLVVVGVVNTAISAYYYLRIAGLMLFQPPESESPVRPTWPLVLGGAVAALGVLVVGFVPSPFIAVAREAVSVFAQ